MLLEANFKLTVIECHRLIDSFSDHRFLSIVQAVKTAVAGFLEIILIRVLHKLTADVFTSSSGDFVLQSDDSMI